MKFIRIIIGALASLFVIMHLIELPNFLAKLEITPEDLHASKWIAKGVAILIGVAIALACFRTKKSI